MSQFDNRESMEAARRANADRFSKGLADVDGLVLPSEPDDRRSVWHQYTLRLLPGGPVMRDEFVEALLARGVGCGVYYPRAAYDYDCYRNHPRIHAMTCPNAEAFATSVASIPVHQHLTADEVDTIISVIREVLGC